MVKSRTPSPEDDDAPIADSGPAETETYTPGLFRFFLAWMGIPLAVAITYVLLVEGVR